MTGNKPMKLWTTIVTAFLALFAALGFTTTATAATAVQETTNARNATECASPTAPFMALWTAAYERSLPPTMKQRIRAEAHGSSPSCRHLPPTDTESEAEAPAHEPRLAAEP